jgi:glycosyltransferase involved in cell wall biosynthesis
LLVPHLGGGGAERVTALLARGLSREKYEVHLGLVTQKDHDRETAPPWVIVHPLGSHRVRTGALRLLRLVRRLKPDLILSGVAPLNFLVLLLRPFYPRKTRVLVRQSTTVSSVLAFGGVPWYTRLLYRFLYPRADRIICQSRAVADDLAREIGLNKERIAVLPNPADPNPADIDGIRTASRLHGSSPAQTVGHAAGHQIAGLWTGPGPHLLAIGRLAPEKGFDLLLQALAIVRGRFPHADLIIAGAGPEESALRMQCCFLAMEAAVHFPGQTDPPYALYPQASLFVLSSRHEGMPSALLEALAGDLPIVSTPSSGGVVDLLRRCPGTWLANETSSAALAVALLRALDELGPGQRFHRSLRSVS